MWARASLPYIKSVAVSPFQGLLDVTTGTMCFERPTSGWRLALSLVSHQLSALMAIAALLVLQYSPTCGTVNQRRDSLSVRFTEDGGHAVRGGDGREGKHGVRRRKPHH